MTNQAKISGRTKKTLQEIAKDTGESQISIIEHAVLAYHREWRMQKINEAYARLKEDKKSWEEELKERSSLENTLDDGLDDV